MESILACRQNVTDDNFDATMNSDGLESDLQQLFCGVENEEILDRENEEILDRENEEILDRDGFSSRCHCSAVADFPKASHQPCGSRHKHCQRHNGPRVLSP